MSRRNLCHNTATPIDPIRRVTPRKLARTRFFLHYLLMKTITFFRLIFVVYVLAVSWLSLSRPSGITDISSWDKWAHAGAYLVFAVLCGLSTRQRWKFWLAMLTCAIYGLAIEYLQSLTSYRMASALDLAANISGLILGYLLLLTLNRAMHIPGLRAPDND